MAEAVGLAVGIAALFSTCLECLELIDLYRSLGRDYVLVERSLDDPQLRPHIEETLNCIKMLFQDGAILKKKYGLKDQKDISFSKSPVLAFRIFLTKKKGVQKEASLATAARWIIKDKKRFEIMCGDLKNLIDDLEVFTRDTDVPARQRRLVEQEVESINDVQTLEIIESAAVDEPDVVSDAASQRLRILRSSRRSSNVSSIQTVPRSSDNLPGLLTNGNGSIIPNTQYGTFNFRRPSSSGQSSYTSFVTAPQAYDWCAREDSGQMLYQQTPQSVPVRHYQPAFQNSMALNAVAELDGY